MAERILGFVDNMKVGVLASVGWPVPGVLRWCRWCMKINDSF